MAIHAQGRHALLIALALCAGAASAQDLSFEAIAARYLVAQSYCDAGKRVIRHGPPINSTHSETFSRCAHRDGRFKHVENPGDRGELVSWSDGKKHRRFFLYNRFYQEHSLDDAMHYDLYRNRSEIYPVFVFRFLSSEPRELTERERRTKWLQSFKPVASLSTPQVTVFQRAEVERMHVRNADRMIVKHERLVNGEVSGETVLTAAELDRPLGAADLSHDVPLHSRFSPQSNFPAFVAILFVAVLLAGGAAWGIGFARASDPEVVLENRARLWRFQMWAAIVVTGLLVVLAIVTSIGPQSGHPPAIVYVMVLAVFAAIGFGLLACFTLASYPAQWLLRR
ncbi:MAG TPA: hypothetical protein VD965_02125 [Burkholderiales bacterium]|nr:hypothetical protein [Burkholderiales bacterium]